MINEINTIKKLADNLDKPMIECECGNWTEDSGGEVVYCDECDAVIVYREPESHVCPRCMEKVIGRHSCPVRDYDE